MEDSHLLALQHLQLMSSSEEGGAQIARLYANSCTHTNRKLYCEQQGACIGGQASNLVQNISLLRSCCY